MSSNFSAGRFHGAHQDSEMDVTWQELMAMTEMQVDFSILSLISLMILCNNDPHRTSLPILVN